MDKEKTCMFTGHRPDRYSFGYDETAAGCQLLKAALRIRITAAIENGYTHFISGMALGADMWCAETVLELQKTYPHITLEAAIPFEGQAAKWSEKNRRRYEKIKAAANKVTVLTTEYNRFCMQSRDRYMVDAATLCIAVYNGDQTGGTAYTVRYAAKKGLVIKIINPADF